MMKRIFLQIRQLLLITIAATAIFVAFTAAVQAQSTLPQPNLPQPVPLQSALSQPTVQTHQLFLPILHAPISEERLVIEIPYGDDFVGHQVSD